MAAKGFQLNIWNLALIAGGLVAVYLLFSKSNSASQTSNPDQTTSQAQEPTATFNPALSTSVSPSSGATFGGQAGASGNYIGAGSYFPDSFNTNNSQSYSNEQYTYTDTHPNYDVVYNQQSAPQDATPSLTNTPTQTPSGGSDWLTTILAGGVGAVGGFAAAHFLGASAATAGVAAGAGSGLVAGGVGTTGAAAGGGAAAAGTGALALALAPLAIAGGGAVASYMYASSASQKLGYSNLGQAAAAIPSLVASLPAQFTALKTAANPVHVNSANIPSIVAAPVKASDINVNGKFTVVN